MPSADWSANDSMVLQILANILASQNREAKAAGLLEYVLDREPDNHDVIRALCGVYLMLERYEDTLAMAKRYESVRPNNDHRGTVMMVKGQALWELGHTAEAKQIVDQFLLRRAKP